MFIASCQAVRDAEQRLFAAGEITSLQLMNRVIDRMERAVRGEPLLCGLHPQRVVVYAGTGNNAGDAVGLAARLGVPVIIRAVKGRSGLSADTAAQLAGHEIFAYTAPEPLPRTLILDGLLGSGAKGELRPAYAAMVQELNALRAACPQSLTLAVDIPTGLDADTGCCAADVVAADVTADIGAVKPGMLADGAEDAVGRLLPIPLPEAAIFPCSADTVADAAALRAALPRRPYSYFKNRAGRVAIIAGSVGMTGAARMCAAAAVEAGAGLVALYCLPDAYPVLAASVTPEVMVRPVPTYAAVEEPQANVLLIGPGLGPQTAENAAALRTLAAGFRGTVVLDADGLNLAAAAHWDFFTPRFILTPHAGEMRRLDPRPAAPRREVVRRFLEQHDCTLLYKGARTIIADRGHCVYNISGGPYMANGGQGDVLSGVIAALAAQGMPPHAAAALGAYSCGTTAEAAWAQRGYSTAVRATQVAGMLEV